MKLLYPKNNIQIMKAAYLTNSILNIFDDIEKKEPEFSKIIEELKISFSRSVPQKDRILLDSGSLNFENIKSLSFKVIQ